MDSEFQKNLDILLKDDTEFLFPNWIHAASFFFDLARERQDIELALYGLERVYFQSHQLPVMRPAIGAILHQLLKQNDSEHIEFLMKEKESSVWVMEALEIIVQNGTDIHSAVESVVRHFGDSEFVAAKILAVYVRDSEAHEALAELSNMFLNKKGSEIYLLRFLKQVVEFGIDISTSLPDIALILDNPKIKNRVIASLSWIVGKKLNLSTIEMRLLKEITDFEPENSEQIAFYLSSYYIDRKQKPLEQLSAFSHLESVRLGILKGQGNALFLYKNYSTQILDSVVLSLLDKEIEIRRQADQILKKTIQMSKKVSPSFEVLSQLVEGLRLDTTRTFAVEYLADIGGGQKKLALLILKLIREKNLSNLNGISELCETLDPNGKIPTNICSICRKLPRIESWNHHFSLPRTLKKLKKLDHTLYPRLRQCPECENYYEESYEVDTEDMRTRETFTWRRLQPVEILKTLVGKEKMIFLADLETYLDKIHLNLNHPNPFQSSESAWKLAHYYISMETISEIEKLSVHKNIRIREEFFQALTNYLDTINHLAYQTILNRGLIDLSQNVRKNSALSLTILFLDQNQFEEVEKILYLMDSEILSGALTSIYRYVLKKNSCPYLEKITQLITDKNQNVQRLAKWIYDEVKKQGQLIGNQLPPE